jgi:hypothetical protein
VTIPNSLLPFITLGGMFAFIAVLGLIVVLIKAGAVSSQRSAWQQVAARAGLQVEAKGLFREPVLQGPYRGRPLTLDTYVTTSGGDSDSTITYTRVSVTVANAGGAILHVRRTNILASAVGKLLSGQNATIGDETFDKKFLIQCHPPDFAAQVLGEPALRQKVMTLRHFDGLEVTGVNVRYLARKIQRDANFLMEVLDLVSDIADRVDHPARSG